MATELIVGIPVAIISLIGIWVQTRPAARKARAEQAVGPAHAESLTVESMERGMLRLEAEVERLTEENRSLRKREAELIARVDEMQAKLAALTAELDDIRRTYKTD